jgi:hypothetical protein
MVHIGACGVGLHPGKAETEIGDEPGWESRFTRVFMPVGAFFLPCGSSRFAGRGGHQGKPTINNGDLIRDIGLDPNSAVLPCTPPLGE